MQVEDASCTGCGLSGPYCVCPWLPALSSSIHLTLLTHPREWDRPTNTGRLAAAALRCGERRLWHRKPPDAAWLDWMITSTDTCVLVFPDVTDQGVTESEKVMVDVAKQHAWHFVILDGTWQEARKMARLSGYLSKLQRTTLPVTAASRYALRRPGPERSLSTVEAVAALMRLGGEGQQADLLDDYFQLYQQHYRAMQNHRLVSDAEHLHLRLLEWNRRQAISREPNV